MTAADVCARARWACGRGGRGRRCRRSGSRSAWPRWSPCSASRSPPRPTCWPSSTGSGRTCCRSRPGSRSWATTRCCRRRRRRCCGACRGVQSVAATAAVAGHDRAALAVRRRERDRRHQRRRRGPVAAVGGRRDAGARDVPQRRDRAATRRSCSAPRRPTRWGSPTPARACGSAGAGSPSSASSTRSRSRRSSTPRR